MFQQQELSSLTNRVQHLEASVNPANGGNTPVRKFYPDRIVPEGQWQTAHSPHTNEDSGIFRPFLHHTVKAIVFKFPFSRTLNLKFNTCTPALLSMQDKWGKTQGKTKPIAKWKKPIKGMHHPDDILGKGKRVKSVARKGWRKHREFAGDKNHE